MKKPILTTIIINFIILSGIFAAATIHHASAKDETSLIANNTASTNSENPLESPSLPNLDSHHETIYAITKEDGSTQKSFIGNTINLNAKPLPINIQITYYLDDVEIPADQLAGQSGHLRMVYHYTSTKTYQDKLIPFLALTGISLDSTKFTNLQIVNGKILAEGKNTIIAGYALVGLNENLGTDFLPSTFEITADVTDFALDATYTIATNDFFAGLDTSKLTSIDYVINSINELASGFNQIISGATDLNNGLYQLSNGLASLKDTIDGLSTKVLAIVNQAEQAVSEFDHLLDTGSDFLSNIPATPTTTIAAINDLATEHDLDPTLTAQITDIINSHYSEIYTNLTNSAHAIITKLDHQSTIVSDYLAKIKSGTFALQDGVAQLTTGADALYAGSTQLKNGLLTFKSRGLNQLTNFANHDLAGFLQNFRQTIDAASSYHFYATPTAKSTKFIFKTPRVQTD